MKLTLTDVSARYFVRTPQVIGFHIYETLISRRTVAEPVSYTTMLATNDSESPINGELQTVKSCSHVAVAILLRRSISESAVVRLSGLSAVAITA